MSKPRIVRLSNGSYLVGPNLSGKIVSVGNAKTAARVFEAQVHSYEKHVGHARFHR